MSILIQNVQVDGKTTDIAVRGNRIAEIRPGIEGEFDQVIDGSGRAALPPFYNTHCHAAMTLLRGIADLVMPRRCTCCGRTLFLFENHICTCFYQIGIGQNTCVDGKTE